MLHCYIHTWKLPSFFFFLLFHSVRKCVKLHDEWRHTFVPPCQVAVEARPRLCLCWRKNTAWPPLLKRRRSAAPPQDQLLSAERLKNLPNKQDRVSPDVPLGHRPERTAQCDSVLLLTTRKEKKKKSKIQFLYTVVSLTTHTYTVSACTAVWDCC